MSNRAPELPDWVGADRSRSTYVAINFVDIPMSDSTMPLRVTTYSYENILRKIAFGGLDLRVVNIREGEDFMPQENKCCTLSATAVTRLTKNLVTRMGHIPIEGFLSEFSSPMIRSLLSSHLIGRFKFDDAERGEFLEEDDEFELLGQRYSTFVAWGESSPALCLAIVAGKPVEEIHNRLKVARRRGYLPKAGQGIRGADTGDWH